MKRMYLTFMLLTHHTMSPMEQPSLDEPKSTSLNHSGDNIASQEINSSTNIVFVPVAAITPDRNIYNPNQRNLFVAVTALAGTALKMLIDSGNALTLIEGITVLIDTFVSDKTTKGCAKSESFIQELIQFIQEHAKSLVGIEKEKKPE